MTSSSPTEDETPSETSTESTEPEAEEGDIPDEAIETK